MLDLASIILLLLASSVNAGEPTAEDSHVIVLDASNLTQVVKQHSFIAVEFYAPGCIYCKQLEPEYEKAAEVLKTHDPPIVLAKYDTSVEANSALAEELYHIHGVPTIKIIENQGTSVRDYKGPRFADGIVSYLIRQLGPASKEFTSAEEARKFIDAADVMIVGLFSSDKSEEFMNFMSIATELRLDFEFKHTFNSALLPEKGITIYAPAIRVFKKFDDGFDDFKDNLKDPEAIKKFIEEVTIPSVVWYNDNPEQFLYINRVLESSEYSKAFLLMHPKAENVEELKNEFIEVAKDSKGKGIRFMAVGDKHFFVFVQFYSLSKESDAIVFIQDQDEKKYILEKPEAGALKSWFKSYFDKALGESFKSEPIPEENNGPVKVVVRYTFEEIVLKSGKNVLVEIYAPWCGYCKKLVPILEEVALFYESDPDVVITKIDGTANDIGNKQFKTNGFPTIYLHTATGKVLKYEGEQSKEDIISFINKSKDFLHNKGDVKPEKKDEL